MTDLYPINDIYPCIQGEGVFSGQPMLLLRLHGCDVGCPFCDTKETWDLNAANTRPTIEEVLGQNWLYSWQPVFKIANYLTEKAQALKWILITGGEPATYPLTALVNSLHDSGFKVALETSGTERGHVTAGFNWVCVSPKINMPNKKPLLREALLVANEIKFVIGKEKDFENITYVKNNFMLRGDVIISLQPMSQNKKATELCLQKALSHNYRLSLQIHKYLNQP